MNGRIGTLGIVLIVQLLIIAGLFVARGNNAEVTSALLEFAPAAVTRVEINEGQGEAAQQALLTKSESGWQLDGLPIDQSKLDGLLAKLADLDSPWPVATTSEAQQRFEVTEDGYQKRVVLFAGEDAVATLLLGTSPGFKRIHARRPEDNRVYSVALTSLDLPVAAADWLDKSLLAAKLKVSSIRREGQWEALVEVPAVAADASVAGLEAPDTQWSLRPLAEGPSLDATALGADAQALNTLVGRFTALQVIAPFESNDAALVAEFVLADADGATLRYQLFEDTAQDQFSISRDDQPGQYEIAGYVAEQMRVSLADLTAAEDTAVVDE